MNAFFEVDSQRIECDFRFVTPAAPLKMAGPMGMVMAQQTADSLANCELTLSQAPIASIPNQVAVHSAGKVYHMTVLGQRGPTIMGVAISRPNR